MRAVSADFAGAVPLLIVAVLLFLFARHFWAERREPHLMLLLTAAMAFFNVAIVMLLPVPWIVVDWAAEAVVLIELFVRFAYRLFRFASVGLAVALFVWITIDARIYAFNVVYYRFFDRHPTIELIFGFAVVLGHWRFALLRCCTRHFAPCRGTCRGCGCSFRWPGLLSPGTWSTS